MDVEGKALTFEALLLRVDSIRQETLRECPWLELVGKAQLRESWMVQLDQFIVVEPSGLWLQMEPNAGPTVFICPTSLRALEDLYRTGREPFFMHSRAHDEIAAICVWLARERAKGAKS